MQLTNNSGKAVKCVLFDLDGVMVHPWGFAKLLDTKYGISKSDTQKFFVDVFPSCAKGEVDLKEALIPYLKEWSWQKTVDQFVLEWLESEDLPNHKMVALVKELKHYGYHVCLATNQETYRAEFIDKQMKFGDLFDHLFISCRLGKMKPEQEFYQLIQAKLELSADQILFIDDQQHYIDAALEQGWNAIQFEDYESLIELLSQPIKK